MTTAPAASNHTQTTWTHGEPARAEAILLGDYLHKIHMDQGSLSSLLNGLSYYPPGWKEVTLLRVIAQRPDGESVVVLLHPGDDDGRTASDVQTDGSNASNASNARTRTDRPESQDRPDIFFKSDDGVMLEENCKWVRGRCPEMRLQYVDGHGDTALVEGRWTAFRKAGRVIDQTFGQVCPGVPTVDTYTVDTSDLGAKTAGSTDDTDGTIGGSEP